jgi:hypothetical protein
MLLQTGLNPVLSASPSNSNRISSGSVACGCVSAITCPDAIIQAKQNITIGKNMKSPSASLLQVNAVNT